MKEKLEMLEKFQSRTVIVNPEINDVHVFAITTDQKSACSMASVVPTS